MSATQAVGRYGEEVAATYLSDHGLEVVHRNWRPRGAHVRGELDIIALDRAASTVVFAEVKTRRSARAGTPAEAVTYAKLRQIRQLAALWCQQNEPAAKHLRIDVVCVTVSGRGAADVVHVPGVG